MTPSTLGLESANRSQGYDVIPSGTQVTSTMAIRAGNTGLENLLKRTSKGDALFFDVVFTVVGGEHDKRKIFHNMLLEGTTAGHAKAGEFSRGMLRAIFEAVHGIDPNDNAPATVARRANATLAGFNGATFLAVLEVEKGGQKPDGGFYKDKNIIGKVLRPGDSGYRKLDQPPPQPIERSGPPPQQAPAPSNGSPAMAIAKPDWAV